MLTLSNHEHRPLPVENIMERVLFLLFLAAQIGAADILHESAPLPPMPWTGGLSVVSVQFVGTRFELARPARITAVGGAMASIVPAPQQFFVAFVQLPDLTAYPSSDRGVPFRSTPLFTALFTVVPPGQDIRVPTSLIVPSGAYALVFGSGLFGAPASEGYLPASAPGVPGTDIIAWYVSSGSNLNAFENATWNDQGNDGRRFVVEGVYVPEPASLSLLCVAACLLSAWLGACHRVRP